MTLIPVFAGPSLPPSVRPEGPFDWRPPAVAGDILALLEQRPERLCLIDGLFDTCPAPWHKELLLAMSRGTIVFGASSMGALRAAELHRFGMIGVGAIFSAYRDERICGDDEVALAHGPGELDWAPLSVPMVEVRATLVAACRVRLLDPPMARRVRRRVHDIFFADRNWATMRKACMVEALLDEGTFDRLASLHVPLKQQDALACLDLAVGWSTAPRLCVPPPETAFLRKLALEVEARNSTRRSA